MALFDSKQAVLCFPSAPGLFGESLLSDEFSSETLADSPSIPFPVAVVSTSERRGDLPSPTLTLALTAAFVER